MRRSDKKHEKSIGRRRKLAERRRKDELAARREMKRKQYPDVVFQGSADEAFVALIKQSVSEFDFDSPMIHDWERNAYRIMAKEGFPAAFSWVKDLERITRQSSSKDQPKDLHFVLNFGHQVFRRLGERLSGYLLTNDIWFQCAERRIVGQFRRLNVIKGRTQEDDTYFSPSRPTVDIDGKSYVVGFFDPAIEKGHAMQRICQRAVPTWRSYAGHGDAFHIFHDCKHYVPHPLLNERGSVGPGILVFQRIPETLNPFSIPTLFAVAAGLIDDDGSGLFVKLGYCPVRLVGEFAKARTFLPPGFRQTPEADCYRDVNVSEELRSELENLGTANNAGEVFLHGNPHVLRYFHQHGFPQVLRGSDPSFSHIK